MSDIFNYFFNNLLVYVIFKFLFYDDKKTYLPTQFS